MRRKLLLILGLVALLFGGVSASLFAALVREHAQAVAAAHWTPVEAKLLSFRTGFQMKKSAYTVTAEVTYAYSVGGRPFQGNRLGFLMRDRFPSMADALAEIDRLAKSVPSQAYYNPADPSESVLSIGHGFEDEYRRRLRVLLLGTGAGAAVILGSLWLAWRFGRRASVRPVAAVRGV
jgi:hypothetical protein